MGGGTADERSVRAMRGRAGRLRVGRDRLAAGDVAVLRGGPLVDMPGVRPHERRGTRPVRRGAGPGRGVRTAARLTRRGTVTEFGKLNDKGEYTKVRTIKQSSMRACPH